MMGTNFNSMVVIALGVEWIKIFILINVSTQTTVCHQLTLDRDYFTEISSNCFNWEGDPW